MANSEERDKCLEKLYKLSKNNKGLLKEVTVGSCFCCLDGFSFEDVVEWVDRGETALCPLCRVDAVLPGIFDPTLLKEIQIKYF